MPAKRVEYEVRRWLRAWGLGLLVCAGLVGFVGFAATDQAMTFAFHCEVSPNADERPAGRGPDLVVLHFTEGASDESELRHLCDSRSRASYHYHVGRDGVVRQLVAERMRAWHAGDSRWDRRWDVNDFSIGVGFGVARGDTVTHAQFEVGAELVADILIRRGLRIDRIVGHADVALPPGRKSDPDPFPWQAFRRRVVELMHPEPPDSLKLAA